MKPSDFIVENNPFIAQDADEMHRDNEVQMARSDLYAAADYAIKLHKILRGVSDSADMEQWVMEKIAIANENLRTVYEYMNYEAREQEGALPAFQFESADAKYEEMLGEGYSMADVQRDAEANARKTIDKATAPKEKTPFMAQVGKKIVGGVAGAVTGGIKGAAKGFGFTEGEDERKQNALWAQINQHEQAAKKSKDLKQQHHLKMADQLRSQLKTSDNEVAEGVAETVTMADAMKVLRQYGADNFKTTSNELHFYKNGKPMSVGLELGADSIRHVSLSSLNSATRQLKGQGVAEGEGQAALKKVKNSYNQAAKDAGGDWVGAGKKIDNMKKSLRAKDVGKDKSVAESCDAGATGASAMATGAVGAVAPQRRVKQESAATKKYGNAMKTKAPKIGKGVY